MQTPENFRSLAALLMETRADDTGAAQPEPAPTINESSQAESAGEEIALAREMRLFHARVIEAIEQNVQTLLSDIAAAVLARELQLAPVEIESIVNRVLSRFALEEPLRVRVHPAEAGFVAGELPVVADERLRPGDAIVELRSGEIDATLGMRLASIMQAWT